jgi:hypothetical protein
MRNQNRILFIFVLLTTGISAQQVSDSARQVTSGQAMGELAKDKENQVAKSFETIRTDAKLPQLTRIKHRDSLEQHVCTVALTGVLPKNNIGDKTAIFKSVKPESISTELKQVALFDDFKFKNGNYPRYSVAVWRTTDPQTGEPIYWVGVGRYWSALEEFVDYHFTDDVFYHDGWKKYVAPQCRGK